MPRYIGLFGSVPSYAFNSSSVSFRASFVDCAEAPKNRVAIMAIARKRLGWRFGPRFDFVFCFLHLSIGSISAFLGARLRWRSSAIAGDKLERIRGRRKNREEIGGRRLGCKASILKIKQALIPHPSAVTINLGAGDRAVLILALYVTGSAALPT